MDDLLTLLRDNRYPGRGIAIGRLDDTHMRVFYFIMGRSENSRNRVFSPTDDGIRTMAFDPGKLADPSLVIYRPVRQLGDTLIVTNGNQTDTIRDALASGGSFGSALMTRTFEPDGPLYTPRISAILRADGSFALSILKNSDGDAAYARRFFFEYSGAPAGCGYFISTYQHDGNPPPSFAGEPIPVTLPTPEKVWAALHPDNRISLYACSWDLTSLTRQEQIFNKNEVRA